MKLIYQSPKKEKRQSQPIDEADLVRRQILENAGWKVVARIEDEGAPQSVESEPDTIEAITQLAGLDDEIKAKLMAAGYETNAAVHEATDDELLAIEGIGSATLRKIRDALAAEDDA